MIKKILLSFLASIVLLQGLAGTALAASPSPATWYNQGIQEWYLKVFDVNVSPPEEIFGERYTAAQVDWIIWSFITWLPTKIIKPEGTACLIGILASQSIDFKNCWNTFFGYAPGQEPKYAYIPPRVYDKTLLQMIFSDRQFSGVTYVRNLAKKLTIPEAHAQGFGFTRALEPFRAMWLASRDVAYALFIFAAVILAFMVMFRVKLSPQTAVSVQSAIPKLIFSLLLVTFSYAIAGFLVDLTYVVIGLVSIVGARFGTGDPRAVYEFLTVGPVVPTTIGGVTIPGGGTALGLFGIFYVYLSLFAITFVIAGLAVLGGGWVAVLGILSAIGIVALVVTGLGTIALILFFVGMLILLVAILIMILKTWWTIMKAFANIILLTIFAPFQLLLGTFIPSMGFGAWVKSYISNLAVFVAVGFLFLLATIFCLQAFGVALQIAGQPNSWLNSIYQIFFGSTGAPPAPGAPTPGWPPLILSASQPEHLAIVYLIFSMVIFFQIPKAADIIKSFISGRPWAYGTAIGEGLGLFGSAYGSSPMTAFRKESAESIAAGGSRSIAKILEMQQKKTASTLAGVFRRIGGRAAKE